MSELKVIGKITKVLDIESGVSKSQKEWKKQTFVIDSGSQFNPEVAFSLFGDDKIKMLSRFEVGKEVEVKFNVSSREFNGKYYHNLDAWSIQFAGNKTEKLAESLNSSEDEEIQDLPF